MAHGFLVPLDTVKIRMQTAPQGTYSSFSDATVKVLTFNKGSASSETRSPESRTHSETRNPEP